MKSIPPAVEDQTEVMVQSLPLLPHSLALSFRWLSSERCIDCHVVEVVSVSIVHEHSHVVRRIMRDYVIERY